MARVIVGVRQGHGMIRFEVFEAIRPAERSTDRRDRVEGRAVVVWLDAADVFAVTAHEDDGWAVLTFRAGVGRRDMTVRGTADAVAGRIGDDLDRRRWPARRKRA